MAVTVSTPLMFSAWNLTESPTLRVSISSGGCTRHTMVMAAISRLTIGPWRRVSLPLARSIRRTTPSLMTLAWAAGGVTGSACSGGTIVSAASRGISVFISQLLLVRSMALMSCRFAHGDFHIAGLALGRGSLWRAHRLGHRSGDLACLGAGRLPVPAGVGIIAAFLTAAHLHHSEHSARLDPAERSFSSDHRQRVVGQRYLHPVHVGHAAV